MRELLLVLAIIVGLWIYSRVVLYYTYSARDDSAAKKTPRGNNKPHSENDGSEERKWET